MSLLSSLCLSLETETTSKDVSGESSDSDDFGGKADELGLGGAALKGIMDVMKGQQGVTGVISLLVRSSEVKCWESSARGNRQ